MSFCGPLIRHNKKDKGRRYLPKNISKALIKDVQEKTKLTVPEISVIYNRYRNVAPYGVMTLKNFEGLMGILGNLDDTFLCQRIYHAFDLDNEKEELTFLSFATAIGVMLHGTDDEKLELAFKILCPKTNKEIMITKIPSRENSDDYNDCSLMRLDKISISSDDREEEASYTKSLNKPKNSNTTSHLLQIPDINKTPFYDKVHLPSPTNSKQNNAHQKPQSLNTDSAPDVTTDLIPTMVNKYLSYENFYEVILHLDLTQQLLVGENPKIDNRKLHEIFKQIASHQCIDDNMPIITLTDFKQGIRTNPELLCLLGLFLCTPTSAATPRPYTKTSHDSQKPPTSPLIYNGGSICRSNISSTSKSQFDGIRNNEKQSLLTVNNKNVYQDSTPSHSFHVKSQLAEQSILFKNQKYPDIILSTHDSDAICLYSPPTDMFCMPLRNRSQSEFHNPSFARSSSHETSSSSQSHFVHSIKGAGDLNYLRTELKTLLSEIRNNNCCQPLLPPLIATNSTISTMSKNYSLEKKNLPRQNRLIRKHTHIMENGADSYCFDTVSSIPQNSITKTNLNPFSYNKNLSSELPPSRVLLSLTKNHIRQIRNKRFHTMRSRNSERLLLLNSFSDNDMKAPLFYPSRPHLLSSSFLQSPSKKRCKLNSDHNADLASLNISREESQEKQFFLITNDEEQQNFCESPLPACSANELWAAELNDAVPRILEPVKVLSLTLYDERNVMSFFEENKIMTSSVFDYFSPYILCSSQPYRILLNYFCSTNFSSGQGNTNFQKHIRSWSQCRPRHTNSLQNKYGLYTYQCQQQKRSRKFNKTTLICSVQELFETDISNNNTNDETHFEEQQQQSTCSVLKKITLEENIHCHKRPIEIQAENDYRKRTRLMMATLQQDDNYYAELYSRAYRHASNIRIQRPTIIQEQQSVQKDIITSDLISKLWLTHTQQLQTEKKIQQILSWINTTLRFSEFPAMVDITVPDDEIFHYAIPLLPPSPGVTSMMQSSKGTKKHAVLSEGRNAITSFLQLPSKKSFLFIKSKRPRRMYNNRPNFDNIVNADEKKWFATIRKKFQRYRTEYKILGPSKGMAVHFGHPSWNLVLGMMIGIRIAAGHATKEPQRRIEPYDFIMKNKFDIFPQHSTLLHHDESLHPRGLFKLTTETTQFIDYAPVVFHKLREMFGVNSNHYLTSVGPEQLIGNMVLGNFASLSELCSEGKSGAFFYYTADGRFLIKTVTKTAAKFLQHILKDYYMHMTHNPQSLITRFFGFHALLIKRGSSPVSYRETKLYFIIMGNIFHAPAIIHRRYDLKGSWIGRSSGEAAHHDPTLAMKDVDFVKMKEKLLVGPAKRIALVNVIEKDAAFFKNHLILDYSLLVGIHYRSDLFNAQQQQDEISVCQASHTSTFLLDSIGINQESFLTTAGIEEKDKLLGGIPSFDQKKIYYLGVIDILTHWTSLKRLEHGLKSIRLGGGEGISCIHPNIYAARFVAFLKENIE